MTAIALGPDTTEWYHALEQLGLLGDRPNCVLVGGLAGSPDGDVVLARHAAGGIDEYRPRFFALEKVRGMASPRNLPRLLEEVDYLRELGYHVEWKLLDAKDQGSSSSCKRVFVCGIREDVRQERVRNVYDWRGEHHPIWWPRRGHAAPFEPASRSFPRQALRELLAPNVR